MRNAKAMNAKRPIRVWVIRAGRGGEAHDLFLGKNLVALSDAKLGDLSKLEATRGEVSSAYRRVHPHETRIGSAGISGKFFRFAHEINVGDLIIYFALPDKQFYVGEVTGSYRFNPKSDLSHQRSVKWKYVIPKGDLSIPALYELGAARTFFEFKSNVPELMKKINDGSLAKFVSKARNRGSQPD